MPDTCAACRFYSAAAAGRPSAITIAGDGECRREAPAAKVMAGTRHRTWPPVYDDDWCGSFKPILPGERMVDAIRAYIGHRWGVTIMPCEAGNATDRLGWYDRRAVYLPREVLRIASGSIDAEAEIAAVLERRKLLAKTESGGELYVRYVPKVGRMPCYALRRPDFGA